jgi:hypothetical protein
MKEIKLTQNKVALVDDEDFERLKGFHWYTRKTGNLFYAVYKIKKSQKSTTFYMHRIILQVLTGVPVDHVDGNGLNNQKVNLRLCTHQENMQNRKTQKNNKSGLKGVSWHKNEEKWRAVIKAEGKYKHLGYFPTKELAALAYNEAAVKYFGEFARTNNI